MAKTEQKIIKIVDGSNTTIELTIEQLGLIAAAAVGIWAEDVDSPGTYQRVQGQYNADGYFELLTAGSGGSTPAATSRVQTEGGFDILLESGTGLALEA